MAPTTRKLFLQPGPCVEACNNAHNPYRVCPFICIPLCPDFCQLDFLPPPPPPPPPPINHYHNNQFFFSPVFIAMFALLASAFVIAVSFIIYSRKSSSYRASPRRRLSNRASESDTSMDDALNFHPAWYIATVGLQRSAVESIAVCEYRTGDGLVLGTGCAVCLAEYRDGDALRLLPKCCHAFHVPCIDTWLASRTTCPVCRAPVLPPNNSSLGANEARVVQIVDESSSSAEVGGEDSREVDVERVVGRDEGTMRRAASMGSLCFESGEKMNCCSSGGGGCNSLVGRSLSCTGKLFSSTPTGMR